MPITWLSGLTRITSYDEAMEIVLSRHFRQDKERELAANPLKADTLVMLYGANHTQRRRFESPLFARPILGRLEVEVLDRSLATQLRELETSTDSFGRVRIDLLTLARRSLLAMTVSFIGLDPEPDRGWWDQLAQYLDKFGLATVLPFKFDAMSGEIEDVTAAASDFRLKMFEPAWERRRQLLGDYEQGRIPEEELPRDLLTTLLRHLPDRNPDIALRETILFFNGSIDNVTQAAANTILHLNEWFAEHPADRDRVTDLGFLQAAVFEALRLHPTPGLFRTSNTEVVLSTGRPIALGETVMLDLPAANRDPSVFGPNANTFDPFRVLPIGVKRYGLSFGAAAHKCIGQPMATSHDLLTSDAAEADAIGSVLRIVLRMFALDVAIDVEHPPRWREGFLQERLSSFQVLLTLPRAG